MNVDIKFLMGNTGEPLPSGEHDIVISKILWK